MHSAAVDRGGAQKLDSRLQELGGLDVGQRFMLPGTGRSGRVLVVLEGGASVDAEVLVELDERSPKPERRTLRASLRVQPQPDPPADEAA